jgi:NTP pyrophosphatase (non-canonical NTP hydrolase)
LAGAGRFEQLQDLIGDAWVKREVAPSTTISYRALLRVATGERDFEGALVNALVQGGRVDEAWQRAHEFPKPEVRAIMLASLAGALALTGDSRAETVFAEAGEVAKAIEEGNAREDTLLFLGKELVKAGRFKDAEEIALETDQDRIGVLHALVVALTRAGRLGEAKEIIFSVRDDHERDDLHHAMVTQLVETGCHEEAWEMARSIASEERRVKALGRLATALSRAGDGRAPTVFDEAGEVTRAIRESQRRAEAQNHLASALAQSGRFGDALTALGPQTVDAFMQTLADWSEYFEAVESGLFLRIMREVTSVLGWVYPNWRKYHELLSTQVYDF